MKNITLTFNEALVLIAEGMTMNNVKTLANKLRNADAPVAATNTQFTQYDNEVAKQNLKLANQQVYDLERALEKAKQTETTLRKALAEEGERLSRMTSKIRDLENDAKQDAESLKYFRKWVEDFRIKAGYAEGVTPATVFSDVMESLKPNKEACKRADDLTTKLVKANDVIAAVKLAYDERDYAEITVESIKNNVEAYYRGN